MLAPWKLRPAAALAFAAFAAGCNFTVVEATEGDTSTTTTETGEECLIGSLGCVCTPGGGCDPGLECMAGLCGEIPSETETGGCTELECECGGDEDCDDGLLCLDGSCQPNNCGDGVPDPGEACDDGNKIDGDGCDPDCTLTEILEVSAGSAHTCALIEGGRIRCWGSNGAGQTGYGTPENIGDDESPRVAGDLPLPAAVDISTGGTHTCAVFEDGAARCWGLNVSGQLGLGNSARLPALGDDEPLDGLASVNLVAPVNELVTGVIQTCVRVAGQLRCWGDGSYGQLGLANLLTIGDDEQPLDVPAVMIGSEPINLALGGAHGCAIMAGGELRCWGRGDYGQLGLGSNAHIGDNEHPADVPPIDVIPPSAPPGTTIVDVGAGLLHTCALLSNGDVMCWGSSTAGQLGMGSSMIWGDQPGETPAALGPVPLAGPAVQIAVGYQHSCALQNGGAVRCWGNADSGQLGYGDEEFVGLVNVPADRGPLQLGAPALQITAGGVHTCALLEGFEISCWGNNQFGQLGYGFDHTIGDDEIPEVAGVVDLL